MPSSFAHYAIGAAAVSPFGFSGRQRALLALWAVAPDLDVITAAAWLLVAPHLPFSADVLVQGTYLFTHRGFSHSVFSAPLVAGALWWWRRDRRWALAGAAAWLSHPLLDLFTPWRVVPFWPLTAWEVHVPVVIGIDPLLTVFALAATAALLAQTEVLGWLRLDAERRHRWTVWGRKWATTAVALSVAAVGVGAASLALTAQTTDASFAELHPAGTPRTLALVDNGETWRIERRWTPWDAPHVILVRKVDTDRVGGDLASPLERARCVLDHLGPYNLMDEPAWRASVQDGVLELRAVDVVRNATREGGPAVVFKFESDQLTGVHFASGSGDARWFTVRVPAAIVEAAPCA